MDLGAKPASAGLFWGNSLFFSESLFFSFAKKGGGRILVCWMNLWQESPWINRVWHSHYVINIAESVSCLWSPNSSSLTLAE